MPCVKLKSILNPICRYLQTLPRTRVLSTCSRHKTRVDFSIGHGCPCCINILSFFWERDISFEVRKWLDSLPLMWKLHSPSHNQMTVLGMRWFAHNSFCFSRKKASTWDIPSIPSIQGFRDSTPPVVPSSTLPTIHPGALTVAASVFPDGPSCTNHWSCSRCHQGLQCQSGPHVENGGKWGSMQQFPAVPCSSLQFMLFQSTFMDGPVWWHRFNVNRMSSSSPSQWFLQLAPPDMIVDGLATRCCGTLKLHHVILSY